MRRTMIAAGIAAGALTIGMAGPALAAGNGHGSGTCDGTCDGGGVATGTCDGTGTPARDGSGGQGAFGMQGRNGAQGTRGTGSAAVGTGTLTTAQKAELAAMAEEEKLAGDLYAVLGATFGDPQLVAIAASEDRHLSRVQMLMTRYGVDDPTQGLGVGEFASPEFQALYDQLLADGQESLAAAYQVGVTVEKADIADLRVALKTVTAPDVVRVYTNLKKASKHHLAAFRA